MNIKPLILETLQDSGPSDIATLRETMFAVGGLQYCCITCISVYLLIRECKVSVVAGVYSLVPA